MKGVSQIFVRFLRESAVAQYAMFAIRLCLGWFWMQAGWRKVTGEFDASAFLEGAIGKAQGENPVVQGWWANFLQGFALPNVEFFNFLVAWGELFVGIALIFGTFTTFAALMGMIMNFSYLFSGSISVNPVMILSAMFILVAGFNAAKIGLDYWIVPYAKQLVNMRGKSDLGAVQKTT